MATTESFPVATRQASQDIAGFPTEVRSDVVDTVESTVNVI